jgi:hypothetical protein
MTEDTFDKIKKGVKDAVEKVTDTDTHTGSDEEKVKRVYNQAGDKEPMNPEDIAEHEATAVKRDQYTEIAEEGQTRTDSPEAREKYKKSGMTETK